MKFPNSTLCKALALLLPFAFLSNTVHFKPLKRLLPMPVLVTATVGTASGDYATLGAAFTAINNGIHKGTITLNIIDNITEGVSAVLNSSGTSGGTGTSSYSAITIQPSGGASRTISGNIAGVTSNPASLIDLNGADNITINGLNTGGNSLIFDNQSRTAASTIRVKGDAANITLKKCIIKGAGDESAATILIQTTNDNFLIDDCDVTASSTGAPTHGIYFDAVSTTDNLKVTNSRISDFQSNSKDAYGIRIGVLGKDCEISSNSFFQTATRTVYAPSDSYCVGAGSSASIANLSVTNNYFGGQALNAGSTPLSITGSGSFKAVSLNIGTANTASIQNNTFKNMSITTSGTNAMIALVTGSFDCGNITGNIIGGDIVAAGGTLYGIIAGTGTPKNINISNNVIKNLSNAGVIRCIGITKSGSYTVSNNQVFNNTVTSGSNLIGIFMDADPPTAPATSTNIITGNTIYGLTGAGTGDVYGIEYRAGGTINTFNRNFIYNLTTTGSTYKEFIMGVNISATTTSPVTFSNNMISLGNNLSRGATIYGFRDTIAECTYYNNSVFIGGTGVSSSGNTFAYYSGNKTNTRTLKNNIFSNLRTNSGGTGTNYSIQSNNLATLVIDNNLYYGNTASGSGYKIGKYGSTDYLNFCAWQATLGTGKEANSLFKDPKFIDPTATTPDLHLQATNPAESKGVAISAITTDFDGTTRSSTPDIGADEGNFTLDPQVALASLGSAVCFNAAPIALSGGSPTGGSFSGTGVSGSTFTPSTAGAGTHIITYTYNNNVDICNATATQSITVNAQPATPSVNNLNYCVGETPVALAVSGANLKWYTATSGGTSSTTAPTPSTTNDGTTSYFVSQTANNCESPRAQIEVVINAIPATPSVNNLNYCVGETPVALAVSGANLKWYTATSGGTSSTTAPTPSTNNAGTTSYFVSQTANNCESPRAQIDVVINAIPATPSVNNLNYCVGETPVDLAVSGANLKWYSTANGGTSNTTAPTPSTNNAGTTSYFVSQTTNNCESPRAQIEVVINAIPATPSVTNVNYCVGETPVALAVSGVNLKWYSATSGGTSSTTAPTPSTTNAGATSYFVSQTTNNCESPRAQIDVVINAIPATPSVNNLNYCVGETPVALAVSGANLKWYSTAIGGTSSTTAPTPSTNNDGTTSYFVSQTTNNCESPRAQIDVVINAIPATPSVNNLNYCVGETPIALAVSGANLKWYSTASGGTSSATAPTPSTNNAGTTSFFVTQTANNCESTRAQIDVGVNSIPIIPLVANLSYCLGETANALTAAGSNLKWYTTANGGVSNPTAPIPSTTSAGTNSYYVSQSDSYCESPRCIIEVTVDEISAPANAGTNLTNTTGNFIITGNTPVAGTGKWSLISGTATIANENAASTAISGVPDNTTAVLRWTITNGACTSTSDVSLKKDPALPLTLLQFEVKSESSFSLIRWHTTDEKNVKGFDLQRSTHKQDFKSVKWIEAKGNGFYQYEDRDISAGITYYYRLKMMDNDGRFDISPIKTASFEGAGENLKIYPNPVTDEAFLSLFSPTENTAYFKLLNIQGQVVQAFSQRVTEGENIIPLAISDVPSGLYFLVAEMGEKRFQLKISKN
jgi:Ig-like domain CHU_C associated/Secretion system C-terminal sorting domain